MTAALDSAIEARTERLKQQEEGHSRREASAERASGAKSKEERKEMGGRAKSCSPLSPPISKESEEGEPAERESVRVGQLKLLPSRRDVRI